MKKVLKWALAGTVILAAAACQREQANMDVSEETGGVKEVTTQFVLNLASSAQTKQTASTVQMDNNFRGMEQAKLFAYKTGMSGTPYVLTTTAPAAGNVKEYDLGLLYANGSVSNAHTTEEVENPSDPDHPSTIDHYANYENSSRRILTLSIPVGVDAFTIYGKAVKPNVATETATAAINNADVIYGATDGTVSATPSSTIFKAKKILNETNTNSYDATARLMIFIINNIMSVSVNAKTDATWGDLPALSWAELGHKYEYIKFGSASRYSFDTTPELIGLEEVLGACYYLFTYIKGVDTNPYNPTTEAEEYAAWKPTRPNGEYRAGSSSAVKAMIQDMYSVISTSNNSTATNAREANAIRLAEVILDRALLFFYDKTNAKAGQYREVSTIQELLAQNSFADEDYWDANFAGAKSLNDYPYVDFGVPEGAAQLGFRVQGDPISTYDRTYNAYDAEKNPTGFKTTDVTYTKDEFFYYHPNHPLVNPTMSTFEPRKYLYPAELWYYVNSPIRTTSKASLTNNDFPNGVDPWNTTSSWSAGEWAFPGKVISSTRGVAVANSINYGVAMLQSSVIIDADELLDNRYNMTNGAEDPKSIDPADAHLQLRGILVGGVNPRMNWQFTRYYTSYGANDNHEGLGNLSLFDGVIYDHNFTSNSVPTTSPKYTLVYDNYNSTNPTVAGQNDVYVALEFVNGGADFWGRDNIIPAGGVFYLVAMLPKPTQEQSDALAWPTDHQIPPVYGVDGAEDYTGTQKPGMSKKIGRVFIQDFVTKATFKINTTSLQNAYYSVPDLRSSQMSLGLSVDLLWTPGMEYELDL